MDEQSIGRRPVSLDRRGFLKAVGILSGAAAMTAACSGDGGPTQGGGTSDLIKIPDTGARLPTENVTLRWLGTPDILKGFIDPFSRKYHDKHGNITIKFDGLPANKIAEVLPLGLQGGSAHDIFQLAGIKALNAVDRGWLAPLDDYIPDFVTWKSAFPKDTFLEGSNVFGGKTYSFPLSQSNRWYTTLVLSNTNRLKQADVDFSGDPPTWTEFRQAVKKITDKGDGQFYGIVAPSIRLAKYVYSLAYSAGAVTFPSPPGRPAVDPRTGQFVFASDAFRGAIEFLLTLKKDGSILPGSSSMTAQEGVARVVQGNAAIMMDGPWTPSEWERDSPDFAFGVGGQPVPDGGKALPLSYTPVNTNTFYMYEGSKLKEVVGEIFSYLGGVDGQKALGIILGALNVPVVPGAFDDYRASLSDQGKAVVDLGQGLVAGPDPLIRNPETAKVVVKAPTPDLPKVLEAVMADDSTDVDRALRKLNDDWDRAFDNAIAAAQKKGAKVSRDDYVFRNYDPSRGYTSDDYAALK